MAMDDDRPISRRDLIRGRLFGRLAGSLAKRVEETSDAISKSVEASRSRQAEPEPRRVSLAIHRPPGAVGEIEFMAGCTRCGDCMSACPVQAIVPAPGRFLEAAATPMIDPLTSACIMCPDMPCITACGPGVLRRDIPVKMGVALVQTGNCIAHLGGQCTSCSERCPVPGAITVEAGRPVINEPRCTGCGVCAMVCPAPNKAISVLPRGSG